MNIFGSFQKEKKEVKYYDGSDRFGRSYGDGDYITFLTNQGEIGIAYVCADKDENKYYYSKVYTEPWLAVGEELIPAPGTIRNLYITRRTYTLEELDANPWSIVALLNDPDGNGMFDLENMTDKSKLW